jgi:tetratricopeptide (TPR) repeat protein
MRPLRQQGTLTFKKMRPLALHVFVVMPFGSKQGIDFDAVYRDFVKAALEAEGYEVFRADRELRAGEIRSDMFQELLLADLVVADLSIDNPNVWYELGVRHALRARGIVLIQSAREEQPFDLYTDRKLRYHLRDGVPDPDHLDKDIAALATMSRETLKAWHGRRISPVYNLLPSLQEPDWKTLRVGGVQEFWERYDRWADRIELARKNGRTGDVLLLADEAPVAAFRADAWIKAGEALRKAGQFDFALEQLDRGLSVTPHDRKGLHEKGICLERLALSCVPGYSIERARAHYRHVLDLCQEDPETWALLGRVDKDAWIDSWRVSGKTPEEPLRNEAAAEAALLCNAIESYTGGFRRNPGHYYSGINALVLMHLYRHLTGDARYEAEMDPMEGAVRYGAFCELRSRRNYWAAATLGDIEVLGGTPQSVSAAYREAIACHDRDWFALHSSLSQLHLLRDLDFRPEAVSAGISVFDRALRKISGPETVRQPRLVFLFSGHMIDSPGRSTSRFPAEKEQVASERISETLDLLGAGPEDLALTQGACGGDLLFTEACVKRRIQVSWLQPFHEPAFIETSVASGGESWRRRYFTAREALAAPVRSAPDELGEPPHRSLPGYAFERCNLWLLYTALACGIEKVRFICLWNGASGDGPGGTEHMYSEVNRRTGNVFWINTRNL